MLHTGDRDHFEDRYAIQSDFTPAPPRGGHTGAAPDEHAPPPPAAAGVRFSYAGVFDGHTAADAAQTASSRLHVLLAGEIGACDRCVMGVKGQRSCHLGRHHQ